MSSYEPIQSREDLGSFTIDDDDDDENVLYGDANDNIDRGDHSSAVDRDDDEYDAHGRILPMEIQEGYDDDEDDRASEGFTSDVTLFSWKDPWFPNVCVVCLFVVPLTILWMTLLYGLLGQWWILTPFMGHAWIALATCFAVVWKEHDLRHAWSWRVVTVVTYWIDVVLLGIVYPLVANGIIQGLWLEPDGTLVLEYQSDAALLMYMTRASYAAVALRVWIGSMALVASCSSSNSKIGYNGASSSSRCPRCLAMCWACLDSPRHGWTDLARCRFKRALRCMLGATSILALVGLVGCLTSAIVHWGSWDAPAGDEFYQDCDPLDATECWLPFPSFWHMVEDKTTETGWRVNLHPRRLPPLKGGGYIDPNFLNELDGFSTMAPILFYMDGLKEALEQTPGASQLMGASMVGQSVTKHSTTLLVDVTDQKLVAHTAEIDYLDPGRPLVLVFPAQPLYHNHHYAVAVANAKDQKGDRLPQSPALTDLLFGMVGTNETSSSKLDPNRPHRYRTVVVPVLHKLAPWLDLASDPRALQLLFDFHTVSASSQLGAARNVREGTMYILDSPEWDWSRQVRVTKQEDNDCDKDGTLLARTIYGDMIIPWFLEASGPGHRAATLDKDVVASGRPFRWGREKFVVHIPCSVRNAIRDGDKDIVQAVMEYGHGLFYGLEEASEDYLQKIADDNRYVVTAMDWRGMSASDLLVVAKTLLSKPSLFEAIRDNLIQGYAAKFALQHFSQQAIFDTDWFRFDGMTAPPIDGSAVTRVFYGCSQGGILGAGYSALAGPTLIDRAILGVPGTPFALVMSRSADFGGYDSLMLLSFYNNRHVRMLLSLVQMAWDSVEGSGVLAPPVDEPFPPTLLQAGLGDPVVPTLAAEALARAYGAVLIPSNPREDVYGIAFPIDDDVNHAPAPGPLVTLTELMYQEEYLSLPQNDVLPHLNNVHFCVRLDDAMIRQLTEFINTGQVLDVCESDGCLRERAHCW